MRLALARLGFWMSGRLYILQHTLAVFSANLARPPGSPPLLYRWQPADESKETHA